MRARADVAAVADHEAELGGGGGGGGWGRVGFVPGVGVTGARGGIDGVGVVEMGWWR